MIGTKLLCVRSNANDTYALEILDFLAYNFAQEEVGKA